MKRIFLDQDGEIASSQEAAIANSRVKELDGLRGVAVLFIVILHYLVAHLHTIPGSAIAYGQKYLSFLWVGVDIFFVLSGYLIGGILLENHRAVNCLKVFYLRRALRLFPAYLLLLAVFAVALAAWGDLQITHAGMKWLMGDILPFWPYLLYLQNFFMGYNGYFGPNFVAATWSLAVEEQFYLVFPLFIRRCPPRRLAVFLLVLIIIAPLIRLGLFMFWSDSYVARYVLLPARWDSLLVGALVAWIVREERLYNKLVEHGRTIGYLFALFLCVDALFPLLGNLNDRATLFSVTIYNLWIGVTVGLLLLLLKMGRIEMLRSFLQLKILRYFGRISYSIYLFHTAILGLTFAFGFGKEPIIATPADWLATAMAFVATIAFAQLTWTLFEDRLIRYGHQWRYVKIESTDH